MILKPAKWGCFWKKWKYLEKFWKYLKFGDKMANMENWRGKKSCFSLLHVTKYRGVWERNSPLVSFLEFSLIFTLSFSSIIPTPFFSIKASCSIIFIQLKASKEGWIKCMKVLEGWFEENSLVEEALISGTIVVKLLKVEIFVFY